jgi:transposase
MKTETATPRTDAIAHRGYNESTYIAEMTGLSRQLERENKTFRAAQKACEDCDAPRVDRIAELERELADLREIFPKVLDALGNGAGCLPSCSVEFMREIPKEVRLVVTGLKRELAAERALAVNLAALAAREEARK